MELDQIRKWLRALLTPLTTAASSAPDALKNICHRAGLNQT